MRLPDFLRAHRGENITIRTKDGSQEIYVGTVDGVSYPKLNAFCLGQLEMRFAQAERNLEHAGENGKKKDQCERYMQNTLKRLEGFKAVQLRSIVAIEQSTIDPSYTFVTITGTEGGITYSPNLQHGDMDTEGALRLAAGMLRDAKTELLSFYRTPPPERDRYRVEAVEKWILENPLQLPINGSYMLSEIRKMAEAERLAKYTAKGTQVPRKWRDLMNKVILMGRLTADPDLKQSQNGSSYARFTLAVNRRGNDEADFIYCAVFGQRAEALARYVTKGTRLLICGHINVESWDDNGQRRYNTSVIVDDWEFCERKADSQGNGSEPPPERDNRRERDSREGRDRRNGQQDRRGNRRERDYYDEPDYR